jgi:hypothetical protein
MAANTAFCLCPGFLLGIFFNPEDESSMFLQNTGLSPNYSVTTQNSIFYTSQIHIPISHHTLVPTERSESQN